jgi:chromosome segregation ATPase
MSVATGSGNTGNGSKIFSSHAHIYQLATEIRRLREGRDAAAAQVHFLEKELGKAKSMITDLEQKLTATQSECEHICSHAAKMESNIAQKETENQQIKEELRQHELNRTILDTILARDVKLLELEENLSTLRVEDQVRLRGIEGQLHAQAASVGFEAKCKSDKLEIERLKEQHKYDVAHIDDLRLKLDTLSGDTTEREATLTLALQKATKDAQDSSCQVKNLETDKRSLNEVQDQLLLERNGALTARGEALKARDDVISEKSRDASKYNSLIRDLTVQYKSLADESLANKMRLEKEKRVLEINLAHYMLSSEDKFRWTLFESTVNNSSEHHRVLLSERRKIKSLEEKLEAAMTYNSELCNYIKVLETVTRKVIKRDGDTKREDPHHI